ncbi:X-ray radiation resistance-associated protein 1 isoform X3 [Perca flavescens]|uniref:X-ray radiation resistance-associated protein 1 isoform X3 n=1 Tax=Perca flavescens TaxID=8167 RepID=UPI00106E4B4E|nr:X-ray radiation resistance-associated protein 1 isoform X3 [Perca flavescens]
MTAASYKFDDGQTQRNATKCFPPWTLPRRRKEGAGHWLVSYRKAEEQRYRDVHRRIKEFENRGADFPYGSLSSFVSLREVNLALNGLCNMKFDAADFPHLEVLDLSYNSLSADDIVSIGRLSRLTVLHLTGNQLHHLPPNLGSSSHDPTQPAKEEDTQFKALEVLMLDDNKLSSGVFNSLANLKRLKYLNLQENHISDIPYLQLAGCSQPLQTSIEAQAEEEELAHTETNPNTIEHFKRISQENCEEHCKRASFPLPELQFLNLANNKIAEEEALMAVALFPMLREIDIHSNPLTTQRSGDPPLLTYYLHERLGITIKRKKTQEAVKLPLKVSADPKWKVEQRIPKKPMLMDKPCPAQSQVEKSKMTVKRTPKSEGENSRDDTLQENTEHFFVTQATDVPQCEFDLQADEKEIAENKYDANSERFTCYKMLMDAKPDPDDVVEPIGIQTAVRMLEHTLKNLNVYRDSKPKLDSIQTAYREREKRIKELPPLKPIKQPTARVDEMIKEIKEHTTIREVPLSSAIHGTGVSKQEHKEALSLLRDMKTKHKMVHKKTMEQEASMESDRNTNQNTAAPPPAQMI